MLDILEHLEVYREFYDLEDPSLLQRFWHKVQVKGKKLAKIAKKIKSITMNPYGIINYKDVIIDENY